MVCEVNVLRICRSSEDPFPGLSYRVESNKLSVFHNAVFYYIEEVFTHQLPADPTIL